MEENWENEGQSYGVHSRNERPRQNERNFFPNRGGKSFSSGNDRNWTSNEESLDIQIDSNYVGRIIGRGGSKIQELQEESGAQIKILKDSEGDGCTSVKLTGSAEAREKAKAMIEELTTDGSRSSTNRSNYGYNNGGSQNGSNVNCYGGNSSGSQNYSANGEGFDRINAFNEESLEIPVASSYIGKVIGRGGSKIKELQDESGAQIKILKDSEADGCTLVKLTGSAEALEKAKAMIEELTTDGSRTSSNRSNYGYNDASQNDTGNFYGGNSGGSQNYSATREFHGRMNTSNEDSLDIQIDSNYVGRVIGRGGSKIQELQEDSGAQIKISKESGADGCTSVKLTGSAESRQKAKTLIEELTTDGGRTNRSNYGYNASGSHNDFYGNEAAGSLNDSANREVPDGMVIQIASNFIGRVIGRGGSKIKELQDESGAEIKILKESEANGCTSIKLTGSVNSQETAKALIEELTADGGRMSTNQSNYGYNNGKSQNDSNVNFYGGNSAGSQNYSANREFHDRSSTGDSVEIQIDSNYVGRVIGRGGSKIQELQEESGAQIKIVKESEANGCTSVKLTGSAEAREKAKTMIEELTSDFGRMSTNRSNY